MTTELTLDEKLQLLTLKNDWQTEDCGGKIQSIFLADGPHGLRKIGEDGQTVKCTAYPNISMLACTWSKEMAELMGSSIADDCIENDVDVLLAPGVNLKRTPLCGRNFEYFSEDPVLAGTLAYHYIRGVQGKGIGTALKHYAANNGENHRYYQNNEIDERTLFEMYLKPFEIALKAKPWTVMSSYNKLNGAYCNENRRLMSILRERFGFQGVVMSDWCAVKNRAKALKATTDLECGYHPAAFSELKDAYEKGFITMEEIDASVERILQLVEKAKTSVRMTSFTKEERHNNAVRIEEEGIVLLKNEDNVLPLKPGSVIDLFHSQDLERYNGLGSSKVESSSGIKEIQDALRDCGFRVNNNFSHENVYMPCAGDYQIVTVSANELEGEGYDRTNLRVRPIDEQKIIQLSGICDNVIVLLYCGSAVDISRFVDKVRAIVYVGFAGEAGAEAAANILSGKVCPSGKLAETFPVCIEDIPVDPDTQRPNYEVYGERFFFGYRYYEYYGVKPQFAFGHGLSYAKFEYSDLQLEKRTETEYIVRYNITNLSDRTAKEVSQVYVRDVVAGCERPEKELKGFSKDEFQPHETKQIEVLLDRDAFAFYNPAIEDTYVENGIFRIMVGAASDDIRLTGELTIALDEYEQLSMLHRGWARSE